MNTDREVTTPSQPGVLRTTPERGGRNRFSASHRVTEEPETMIVHQQIPAARRKIPHNTTTRFLLLVDAKGMITTIANKTAAAMLSTSGCFVVEDQD